MESKLNDTVKCVPFGFKDPTDAIIKGMFLEEQSDGSEKLKFRLKYMSPVVEDFYASDVNVDDGSTQVNNDNSQGTGVSSNQENAVVTPS